MAKSSEVSFEPAEVDELLGTGGGLLGDLASVTAPDPPEGADWIGRRLGAYRIDAFLARGGMSRVFRGQRSDGQFELPVAIKLIDTPHAADLVARFDRERRILAALDHPGIARILDGGVSDGQPYLVMELVEGEPIDAYCDHRRLGLAQRVALVEQVCGAVQYAHTRLVVHRDIKPGNILVTAEGRVKLLDFGIARRLAEDSTDPTTGAPLMTPRYASPEMVSGEPAQVASDIYQLGLLLYWLLVGRHAQDPRQGSLAEIAAVVLEQYPASPSRRIDTTRREDEEAATLIARDRGMPPERLQRLLSGDLDAIVAECLRKRPEQRYGSVNELRADLRAFREHRPVRARRPTTGYRLARFLRRHRGAAASVALFAITLAVALVSMLLSWRQTLVAQQRAEQQAARAQQVTGLLVGLLEGADPDVAQGDEITVREMLDQASRRADTALTDQPLTSAALRSVIGELYGKLGRLDEAQAQLSSALALHARAEGDLAGEVDLKQKLARVQLAAGDPDGSELTAADAYRAARSDLGPDHPATLAARGALAETWIIQGRYDEAQAAVEETIAVLERHGEIASERHLEALEQLGRVHTHRTDYAKARATYEQAIALHRRERSRPSLQLATLLRTLGAIITFQGEAYEQALAYGEEAVRITRELLGDDHFAVAVALGELAGHHSQAGRFDAAEAALMEAAGIAQKRVGKDHEYMATLWNNLAVLRFRQERFDEASEFYTRSIDIYLDAFGPEHPHTVTTRLYRAYGWHLAGDSRAEPAYRELLPQIESVRGPDHVHTSHVLTDLGRLLVETGRDAESVDYLRRALAIREQRFGPETQFIADAKLYLGAALSETGERREARRLLQDAITIREGIHGFREVRIAEAQLYLSRHMLRDGRTAEARELLAQALTVADEKPAGHWLRRLADRVTAAFPPPGEPNRGP